MGEHTFGSQSSVWLSNLETRRRKPVAPATLRAFGAYVRRLLPIIGLGTELATFDNGAMKCLVTSLVAEKLSSKTVVEMVGTVKQIVGSATDDNGNQLFPRTWNSKFIDVPQIGKQKQPCAAKEDVERAIKNASSHQERLFYALLAGSGLRVAEALAIHVAGTDDQTSWTESTSTISVRSSIYRGKEQNRVKTPAAIRTVDLDPRLNTAIARFVSESGIQPGAFLFQSNTGRVMYLQTARVRLKKRGIPGFHSFRRFRITRLRELGVPEDILRFWSAHAGQGITDRYSKLAENAELRRQWAQRAGLGFDISLVGVAVSRTDKKLRKPKSVTEVAPPVAEPTYFADDTMFGERRL